MASLLRTAVTLGLLVACSATRAAAEVSEWQQRIAPAQAPSPKPKAAKRSKVQSRQVAPGQAPTAPIAPATFRAGAAARATLGPATVPDSGAGAPQPGSDPAYDAFEQGKYLTALAIAQKLAKAGDPQAHTLVARIHAEGLGVPQDIKLAAQWYQRGMDLGDREAALSLGTLYARGDGVPQDYAKAAQIFEKVAASGHPEAVYNLALLFLSGKGKAENPRRGFTLMQYAADKGITAAMYDLGTLYALGTGTPANAFEAAKWFGKAAGAGHPDAEIEYAIILLKDLDLPADQKLKLQQRAVELLRSAARKGYAVAQNRLAHCYLSGLGTAKDGIEAAKWHLVAKAGGHEDAALDKALAALSRDAQAKARTAAAAWREEVFLE